MKVNSEIALQEFEKWLDFRKVKRSKRDAYKAQQDIIVEAIEDGDIIITDDKKIEYTLLEPVKSDEGDVMLDKLIFKSRIRKEELNRKYKGLSPNDADGRLLATIAAVTDQNTKLIGKLYTEDASVCEAIAVYFL